MNLTQTLYDLYQNGEITFLADGTASYTTLALMTIAKAVEQSSAFAVVRQVNEGGKQKPDYCADLKSALRMH
jgi:hypothetical protein